MIEDFERCYRAAESRDRRFDGCFFVAVPSTGVYCRPSCPAIVPERADVRFYRVAAAAQVAGFRACTRCPPDAAPGSPEWNVRRDLAGRAMRLIADGEVDRGGVGRLAERLDVGPLHLDRLLVAEVGASAQALARAQRAQTARVLIETTALPVAGVALASGFTSVRQLDDAVRQVFDATPAALRQRSGRSEASPPATLALRLAHRQPFDAASLLGFLGARAIPGVEELRDGRFRRTLRLPHGWGIVELAPADRHVVCALRLSDPRDVTAAVSRCRRLLDLDADPRTIAAHLERDPAIGGLVGRCPGRRLPGHVDGVELAVRAVFGQQISVAAARTHLARLVRACGDPLPVDGGALTHLFPTADAIAAIDPAALALPATRRDTLLRLARALAAGDVGIDPGTDSSALEQGLLAIRGIGPWTAGYIAMRATGDPDVFLASDLGARHALARLGLPAGARAAAELAERWRPWRSYALMHLWATLGGAPGNDHRGGSPAIAVNP